MSPFPASVTIFVSIVGAGLPVALSYGAMGLEFSVGEFAAAAWRYWREPRRYLRRRRRARHAATSFIAEPSTVTLRPSTRRRWHEREPLWDV